MKAYELKLNTTLVTYYATFSYFATFRKLFKFYLLMFVFVTWGKRNIAISVSVCLYVCLPACLSVCLCVRLRISKTTCPTTCTTFSVHVIYGRNSSRSFVGGVWIRSTFSLATQVVRRLKMTRQGQHRIVSGFYALWRWILLLACTAVSASCLEWVLDIHVLRYRCTS